MKASRVRFPFGSGEVTLETGRIARQADGAVLASLGDTVVLCTVVASKSPRPGVNFLPLTVNYQEKTYAAGRIPGSFFRREGRPTEKETLTSRLIDRPIRPLFPKGFRHDVQVVCTVISSDKETNPDIPALLGSSAALKLSGIPFQAPIGAARVGLADDAYLLNPTYSQLQDSMLDMVVAGTSEGVLMVESEALELPEDVMLGGVLYAHGEMQVAIRAIEALGKQCGKPSWELPPPEDNSALEARVAELCTDSLGEAYQITEKQKRQERVREIRQTLAESLADDESFDADDEGVASAFSGLEKKTVRDRLLSGAPRIDGRDLETVRPIHVEVGWLPKTHGSALFTRGETQAMVAATLGSLRDAALIDALEETTKDTFLLHYNFPPYSVGETGMMTGPKRREIGHGRLAKRALIAVMPKEKDFPYTIRLVSDITESNGSSSMATVCGSSLALMDAGIPLTRPVAGVAMGLVKDGNRFAVLTDILGDEDHLGDMDFKVAGTEEGVTALQMDIKIDGITEEIMEAALGQALSARVHILGEMNKVLGESRPEINENAPSLTLIKVHPDKIRDIIGKGGATIRGIVEETGAEIDIDDDGTVRIYADSKDARELAINRVNEVSADAEVGKVYSGKVNKIVEFGAFVNILPGKDGLVHISQIADKRVEKVTDYLEEGQQVDVLVTEIDSRGRIKLSMKDLPEEA
ncbi:MAG: polyribonucleotide nucleotidyltransferase [Gammaproteobacteria bacterium]|nr:polyribonucleotide nucleotidyltransferase [Gammaproteobacteria bacterium]MCY4200726.1 polyribonucleotide nucleotidyltransferase [Gammaproteobacteria bacterium]MCY4276684.1 polyribonucleotide nucleotidyltransferase [Gammaproteobacteria bacterium]MCY4322724.1 polyribonucleotide nucleotidyltransferase [Gammaproteobacteria bacterium]